MSIWDRYKERIDVHGSSAREADLIREKRFLDKNIPKSISYTSVLIFDGDECLNIPDLRHNVFPERKVAIINSDNLDEKTILSMPGEDINEGSLVWWMDNFWIVSEKDANTTLYAKGKLLQCNYLLRWIADDRKIYEQWCIVEDGTKLERSRAQWFGISETVCKKNSMNCWDTLRALQATA